MNIILKNPFWTRKICGTVGMTTINISGRLSGWILPTRNPYNLNFGIGSICKKPLVINDEIKIRDVLNLTVCFNHDIIDGTPAGKFISVLVEQIEKG
jgi:pyruvate/2-oxoglutarate dehydrogenase complex dihydrolipoamide acyltransferase (E2) component